jgi:uncharacterized membrane protein
MTGEHDDVLEAFLRRFKWGLATLPERDREDIVAETRAHVCERVERGDALQSVLAAFGSPESYARTFVDSVEVSSALASEDSTALLATILRRAHRSAVALAAFAVLLALGASTALIVSVAVMKIFDPVHAGLWVSDTQQFIGVIDDPTAARELLGNWVFAIAAAACAVAWIVGRLTLLWAVRMLARNVARRR